jgi:hypothetical protein
MIFAAVGLTLLIAAFIIHNINSNFKKIAIETEAKITRIETYSKRDSDGDIRTMYDVYVSFYVNDREYSGKLNYYSSGMREGGTTKILYHSDDPQNFRSLYGGTLVAIILSGIGLIFFLIGIFPLMIQIMRRKSKQRLILNGRKVMANVEDIVFGNLRVNNQPCKNIICSYIDDSSNNKYLFKSENTWAILPHFDNNTQLPQIEVYIDDSKVSKYYVDLDSWLNALSGSANIIDLT